MKSLVKSAVTIIRDRWNFSPTLARVIGLAFRSICNRRWVAKKSYP